MITEATIRSAIADIIPGFDVGALNITQPFTEAGIDSLDHVMILLKLQELHGLNVPDEIINRMSSIDRILIYSAGLE